MIIFYEVQKMSNNERAALRERAVVYDEITNERDRRPLSLEQLRQRLKHIAGLCWGLSIDIHNEIERNEALKSENKRLQDEINGLRAELKLVRNRENARGVYKRKTRATLEAQSNGETPVLNCGRCSPVRNVCRFYKLFF
mgnify:CR=1 FL=1